MLILFWGIRGVRLINWLPHSASFNAAYFDENIFQPMTCELHTGEKKKLCQWPLLHMDNARPHTSKLNLARMEELCFKYVAYPPLSHNIALSDFFLFGWLKGKLSSRSVSEINGLLKSSRKFRVSSHLTQSRGLLPTASKD
jgi:hypothetical protein